MAAAHAGLKSEPFSGDLSEGTRAVNDLATMLAHGGSSMDVLRAELTFDDPNTPRTAAAAGGGYSGVRPHSGVPLPDVELQPSTTARVGATSPVASVCSDAASSQGGGGSTAGGSGSGSGSGSGKVAARNTMGRKEWSAEEDATILAAVEEHGQKWRIIATKLPGRSDDAVRNRWKRLSAEKEQVAAAVADALGIPGDDKEAKAAAAREAKEARAAKPKPERLAWSKAEDAEIVRCVTEYGLKWGRISQNLPGRTAHAIRNRFHRLQTLQAEQASVQQVVIPPPLPQAIPALSPRAIPLHSS